MMKSVRLRFLTIFFIPIMIASLLVSPAAADGGQNWKPGDPFTLEQDIPINLVFIGYEEDTVDLDALLGVRRGYSRGAPSAHGLPGETWACNSFTTKLILIRSSRRSSSLMQVGIPMNRFQLSKNDME
jgi:hypothetical protein